MNKAVNFRRATASDLGKLRELEEICFQEESFSARQLRYLVTRAKADVLLSEEAGEISSFIILLKRKISPAMRIYSLAVSPRFRGKGLGRKLIDEAEKRARSAGFSFLRLEVSEMNDAAVQLYLQTGFDVVGERPAYYKNGSKALLMRKAVSIGVKST
ncbi:GNAT family N-acetyltransferase [Gaoshiqia sp. Z1-71]|uniref:GNAT family N-acetyltransferase n=1 Tax=Gaoshiqia hydrogeniformans TaxID=3290090 RepID=UPI003BF7A4A8